MGSSAHTSYRYARPVVGESTASPGNTGATCHIQTPIVMQVCALAGRGRGPSGGWKYGRI